jgi:hypothetical protein
MKRLQTTNRGPLRKLKLLLIGLIAASGMLVAAQGASAAVTAAPNIQAKPSNPNITEARVTFRYGKAVSETSTAAPFRFYCRDYPTATPPDSPLTGWVSCGNLQLNVNTIQGTRSFDTPNGSHTFQVAGRESTNISTQGPVATYVWNQNVPTPTAAPTILTKPSDPNTTQVSPKFEFEVSGAETSTANPTFFFCRQYPTASPPASLSDGWANCDYDPRFPPGFDVENESQTFEVTTRTLNSDSEIALAGQGPIASYVWEQDVAPITAAPVITAKPSNPNTTQAKVKFTYTKGAGEISAIDPVQFLCRTYQTDLGPTTAEYFRSCGNSAEEGGPSVTYSDLPNASITFEVAASPRGGSSIEAPGPVASYVWNQNLAAPNQAPTITEQPDDPNTSEFSEFRYTVTEGLADRAQCRLDSGDWNDCSPEYFSASVFNGTHTFEVRGGNQQGWGPASDPITWTVDIPNPDPSVRIDDVSHQRWDGFAGRTLGFWHEGPSQDQAKPAPDMNGDGFNDVIVGGRGENFSGSGIPELVHVLFSKKGSGSVASIDDLSPSEGYAVLVPSGIRNLTPLGDQNGDGIGDLAINEIRPPAGTQGVYRTDVVYGVSDPAELPECESGKATRCLDIANMTSDQGYYISGGINRNRVTGALSGSKMGIRMTRAGDFDGDGVEDLVLGGNSRDSDAIVLKGGVVRTGEIDLSRWTLDGTLVSPDDPLEDEVFRMFLPDATLRFPDPLAPFGDMNGDGKDEIYLADVGSGVGYVVYGRDFSQPDLSRTEFSATDGFGIVGPPTGNELGHAVGDWNGDGRIDVSMAIDGGEEARTKQIMFTPELPFSDLYRFGGEDMPEDEGLQINGMKAAAPLMTGAGDLDNDGNQDLLVSDYGAVVDAFPNAGTVYVAFNRGAANTDISLGATDLDPEHGVAILPSDANPVYNPETDRTDPVAFGANVDLLGDIDADGLPDYMISEPRAGHNGLLSGSVHIVTGSSLVSQTKTGNAVGVDNDSAALNASLSTNNRDSEVWFEYGATDEYGESTEPEEFEGSNAGDIASAGIDGLTKGTEYHYRAVAKNALGLVRYGDDKTFTTTNVDDPDPIDPCVTDSTKPGCADYDPCKVDDTLPGCAKYCEAHPNECKGGGGITPNAKLRLVSVQKKVMVKRGKKGQVPVLVFNAGGKKATGVKICVKAPKKLIKVKKCQTVGSLASGATKTKAFKVKVTKKAKKGKKITLKFTATSKNAGKKTATAKVVVKK